MPIKSQVSSTPCAKKELPFPKLMQSKKNKRIVLFINSENGVIIEAGTEAARFPVGFHSLSWMPSYYEDYKGSVCLENDKE